MVEALLKEKLANVTYDATATTTLTNEVAAAIRADLQSTFISLIINVTHLYVLLCYL